MIDDSLVVSAVKVGEVSTFFGLSNLWVVGASLFVVSLMTDPKPSVYLLTDSTRGCRPTSGWYLRGQQCHQNLESQSIFSYDTEIGVIWGLYIQHICIRVR